jgi:carbon-monoxide dehydrogenase medium subunit
MGYPEYRAPGSLNEALEMLRDAGESAKIIAGGTDLLPGLRRAATNPKLLIDLRFVSLNQIKSDNNGICLGAGVTHSQLLKSAAVKAQFPALATACSEIGSPPIRNRGTLGGNLVQASPAADTAPPLLAYDAQVVLVRLGSKRTVPLIDFFTGPGRTVKREDELLTKIWLPFMPRHTASEFIKLGKRRAMAIAVASVSVRLTLHNDGHISEARIALGSVAPVPLRARAAEAMIEGNTITRSLITEAAQKSREQASPISDIRASADYRQRMVEVLTRRGLTSAWRKLEGGNQGG